MSIPWFQLPPCIFFFFFFPFQDYVWRWIWWENCVCQGTLFFLRFHVIFSPFYIAVDMDCDCLWSCFIFPPWRSQGSKHQWLRKVIFMMTVRYFLGSLHKCLFFLFWGIGIKRKFVQLNLQKNTSAVWVFLRSLDHFASSSWPFRQCQAWAASHIMNLKLDHSCADYSHKLWRAIAPTCFTGRTGYRLKVLWLCWCPCLTTRSLTWLQKMTGSGSTSFIIRNPS